MVYLLQCTRSAFFSGGLSLRFSFGKLPLCGGFSLSALMYSKKIPKIPSSEMCSCYGYKYGKSWHGKHMFRSLQLPKSMQQFGKPTIQRNGAQNSFTIICEQKVSWAKVSIIKTNILWSWQDRENMLAAYLVLLTENIHSFHKTLMCNRVLRNKGSFSHLQLGSVTF